MPSGSDVYTVSVRVVTIHVSLSCADTRARKGAVFCGDHRQINPQSSFGSPLHEMELLSSPVPAGSSRNRHQKKMYSVGWDSNSPMLIGSVVLRKYASVSPLIKARWS